MIFYRIKNKKYVKGYIFLLKKTKKAIIGHRTKCFQKSIPGEYLRNKTADTVLLNTFATQTKSNDNNVEKQELVEETIIPLEKREKMSKKLRKAL